MIFLQKIWEKLFLKKEEMPVSQQAAPSVQHNIEKRSITVGIDFGTSATKVLWFDETRRKRYVACYEESPIAGYPPYCMPSSLGIKESRIYFGTTAERLCEDRNIFRSIKADIGKNLKYDIGSHLDIGENSEIDIQISPIVLATLYIGFVIRHIKHQLVMHYHDKYDLNITFNMAAPLDHLNHDIMETAWSQILFYGEKLSSEIHNEMHLLDGVNLYLSTKQKVPFIKDPQYCCTFVFPETVSAIVSYLNSGKASDGLFGIVDIGAGTTDISFFRHYASQIELKESFYAAKSEAIGMDDFDKAVMEMVTSEGSNKEAASSQELKKALLHNIRCAKTNINHDGLTLAGGSIKVDMHRLEHATQGMREKMIQSYKRTLGHAYKKEMRQDHWNTWTLFLIGGGSRLEMIRKDFECFLGSQVKEPKRLKVEIDGRVGIPGSEKELIWDAEMIALLAVAYGLSVNKLNWPAWAYPREIDPMDPRRTRHLRDREHLYPK